MTSDAMINPLRSLNHIPIFLLKIYRSDHDDEIVLESSNAPYESVILSKNEIVSIHPVSAVIFRRFIKRT